MCLLEFFHGDFCSYRTFSALAIGLGIGIFPSNWKEVSLLQLLFNRKETILLFLLHREIITLFLIYRKELHPLVNMCTPLLCLSVWQLFPHCLCLHTPHCLCSPRLHCVLPALPAVFSQCHLTWVQAGLPVTGHVIHTTGHTMPGHTILQLPFKEG